MAKRRTTRGTKRKQKPTKPKERAKAVTKADRSNLTFEAKWKRSTKSVSDKNPGKATSQRAVWRATTRGHWKKGTTERQKKKGKKKSSHWVKAKTYTLKDSTYSTLTNSSKVTLARKKWYPFTSRKVRTVGFSVRLANKKGEGRPARTSYRVDVPSRPSIKASYDSETGTVKFEITASSDKGTRERYDTVWQIDRTDRHGKNWAKAKGGHDKSLKDGKGNLSSFEGDSKTVSYDVADRASLAQGETIVVRCTAWCRGIAGDSAKAEAKYSIGFPDVVTFGGRDGVEYTISGTTGRDRITFWLSHNRKRDPYTGERLYNSKRRNDHSATRIKLQVLKDSSHASAQDAGNDTGWEDVSGAAASDDDEASALVDTVTNARPSAGKHVWYRIYADKDGLMSISDPVEIVELYTPAASASSTCTIDSAAPSADGKGAMLSVSWAGDCEGIEVSWSDDADAWISTKSPSSAQVPLDGAASPMRVKVSDLDPGKITYIRCRTYKSDGGSDVHGDWSGVASVIASTAPTQVVASAPEWVEPGRGCRVSWTYAGGGTQSQWAIFAGDDRSRALVSGSGVQGSAVVPADVLGQAAASGPVQLVVSVTTGGEWADSAPVQVGIASPPEVEIDASGGITAQPVTVAMHGTGCSTASVHVDVVADGASGEGPGGDWYQPEGMALMSADFEPSWEQQDDGRWAMEAELPHVDGLMDGCRYVVRVTATDTVTGMSGDAVEQERSVAWAHQAVAPSDASTVADYYDDETGARFCEIAPAAPEGAAEGDVCDVYRVTPMGAELVASGVAFGRTVTDSWAPFAAGRRGVGYDAVTGDRLPDDGTMPETQADLRYRLATRTADGDVDWDDFRYDAACPYLRIDWQGGYVELPWNLSSQLKVSKGAEAKRYMDGGVDAYWPAAAEVSGSLSTDLIRLGTPAQREAVYEMAQYQGPCYVRIPDGNAFAADVELGSTQEQSGSGLVAASLDFQVVRLPDRYKAVPYDDGGDGTEQEAS